MENICLQTMKVSQVALLSTTGSDKAIIRDSRKALLFRNNRLWDNKSGDSDFDVPMGCYDGAEVCELVGIFILNKLSNIIGKNSIGLMRTFINVNNKYYINITFNFKFEN